MSECNVRVFRTRVSLILFLLPRVTIAQPEPGYNNKSLGANFELSLPVGTFSDVAGVGYGGNVRFQYGGDPRANLTTTAGYIVWTKMNLPSSVHVEPYTTSSVPTVQVKAFDFFIGGKYYFYNGFFGTVEGGAYFLTYTYEGVSGAGLQGNTTYFMLPIGLGFQKSGIEVGVRYMLLHPDYNQISITLGYNFLL